MEPSDYVYEVYKAKSFSAAAKKNFISQPALSAIVKKIEKNLGVTLFDRSTLPISLTDAGKVYISAIESIRSIKKKMMEELSDDQVVRVKEMDFAPMTQEEALVQIDLLGHDFFVYTDRDTNLVNVLYRRDGGGYGLLKQKD